MEDCSLYNFAYKNLLYSIHFGFYPSGTKLPSVPELCKAFQVSRFTIHSALKMLENEQYVSLSHGRSAIVTYDAQSEECRARYISFIQSTKDALLDLNETLCMVWPEIVLQGLKLCGEPELQELTEIVSRMSQSAEYPSLEFSYCVLKPLGNPLLLNLYLSTALFGHCSAAHLGGEEYRIKYMNHMRVATNQVIALRRAHGYDELKDMLIHNYRNRMEILRQFYEIIPASDGAVERIPYHWNYYMERPSVGFSLAMTLLREIYASYRPGDYLPSVSELSKQYTIPVITVRRAIQMLCDIGVVETVNGKGTRVIVGAGTTVDVSRLDTPNMKKVLLPYLQSLQITLIICKDIALTLFPKLPDNAIEATIAKLRVILASGDYYQTFGIAFKLLLGNSQSPALKEILGALMYFQYLGYPLRDMDPNEFRYDPRSTEALLNSLKNRDAKLFAEELQRLMVDIFKAVKEKLLLGGVTEAESVVLPLLEKDAKCELDGGRAYGDQPEL